MNVEDVIIIGAGPGGLSTALQLHRYGINPRIFEQDKIGGLLHNANFVENYLGFPGGISGPDLVNLFADQIQEYSIRITTEKVIKLDHDGTHFQVATASNNHLSQIVVIASGTKPRQLIDLEIPEELNHQVYYEVYPLIDLKGKTIAIIGAGDAAFDYALNLGGVNEIHILNRGERISCLPLLWERAKVNPRIHYLPNTHVTEISAAKDWKISLVCSSPTGMQSILVNYLIIAVGRDPQLDFISSQFSQKAIQLESSGRLYYVGDVVNGLYRQTSIAVGNGILTAMKVYKHLEENY